MTRTKRIDTAYLVPDPPAPYELECFKVYVPKHTFYIGAFWRVYEFFTTWIAWTRDPLHKGLQAAALWREAYDKARALYEVTRGTCEMNVTGIRTDPLNPCSLQVEFDGNNTWITVADLSKCGGGGGGCDCVYRFNGSTIQHYDDCLKEWVDSGPAYDPSTDNPTPKGIQLPPGSRCDAAWNIAAELEKHATQLCSMMAVESDVYGAALFIAGVLAIFTPIPQVFAFLYGVIELLNTQAGGLWDDAAEFDSAAYTRQAIYSGIGDNGLYTLAGYAVTLDRLSYDAELEFTAEQLKKAVLFQLAVAGGPGSLQQWNKSHGLVNQECSAFEWEHTFDFTTGKYGWIQAHDNGGLWVNDEGWTDVPYTDGDGHKWRGLAIKIAMPNRTLTQCRVEYNATIGLNDAFDEIEHRYVQLFHDAQTVPGMVDQQLAENGLTNYNTSIASGEWVLPIVAITVGHDSNDPKVDPGGSVTVTKIVLTGTGTDPF